MKNVLKIIKQSLRIMRSEYDPEINMLINAGIKDLQASGVKIKTETIAEEEDITDELILAALVAYVKLHFGDSDNFESKRELYEMQKRQLMYTSGYTEWN